MGKQSGLADSQGVCAPDQHQERQRGQPLAGEWAHGRETAQAAKVFTQRTRFQNHSAEPPPGNRLGQTHGKGSLVNGRLRS